jgi:predicted metalloprotease with PDZ domain
MRKTLCIVVALLIVAMAAPAWAGGKEHKKCTADPQECKAKLQQKYANKAWLGIEMDVAKDGTHTIKHVVPGSPAAAAGFMAGDVLLTMNGVKYVKNEDLKAVWSQVTPGSKVVYTVLRGGDTLKLKAKLGHVPDELIAKWIDEHMKKYHSEG